MLDKRRLHAPGSPPCTLLFVVALTITGCLSFWLLNGCPGPPFPISMVAPSPAYELILSGNTSTSFTRAYSMNDLPADDETSLINVRNFRFIINHDPCNKSQPLLLMLIHSAPANLPKRMVIRETWGQRRFGVVVLFLVGSSTDNMQNKLEEEDKIYGDIIQGNFRDSYRNMTYKHVMTLKWATYHCPGAKYVLKLDDDVFVHTTALLEFLSRDLSPWGARRLILCDAMTMALVRRSWRSKWRVSPSEYSGKIYPDYCAGWAILYSPDSVFLLYKEAQRESYFWIDDVHITGTLAKKVNLTHTPLNSLILTQDRMESFIRLPFVPSDFLFGPANMAESDIRSLWKAVASTLQT